MSCDDARTPEPQQQLKHPHVAVEHVAVYYYYSFIRGVPSLAPNYYAVERQLSGVNK